ncbi:MAG: peptidoglycan-binding protein [Porcipelethomonas sp.]
MAFTDDQKREHISELQDYLYGISHHDERIPPIIPDGVYGRETTEAIKAFQRTQGLPVSGTTDSATWSALAGRHRDLTVQPEQLDIFPKNYILVPESTGELVYIIQMLLNILSREYANIPLTELNGIYSPEMQNAVTAFKNISGTDQGMQGIGTDTWNMLAQKVNSKNFAVK